MQQGTNARFYRPELDVVRLLAFLAVFLSHGIPLSSTTTPAGAAVRALSLGLSLFFCLSAFLITKLLLTEREQSHRIDTRKFYIRRALRILPLYFTILILSGTISALHHTLSITWQWYVAAFFMVANTVWWIRTTVTHLWSISVEEQFYLVWPHAVARLSRRQLLGFALFLIVVANVAIFHFGAQHLKLDGRVWYSSLAQLEFFATGIVVALCDAYLLQTKIRAAARVGLFGIALVAWFCSVRILHAFGNPDEFSRGPVTMCVGYAIAALGCSLIMVCLKGLRKWPKALLYLGKTSYGLYVFHPMSLTIADRLVLQRSGRLTSLALAFCFTVLLASLSYEFFEKKFLRLKERYEVVKSRPINS